MFKCMMLIVCSFFMASCATTEQGDVAKMSGFLKDYSMLKEGSADEAQLVYVKDAVSWKKYNKIMIDPIHIWANKGSELKAMNKEELKNLVSLLNGLFSKEIKGYTITTKPGPDTLRLKIAMTDGESSSPVLDTLSSLIPVSIALTYLKKAATGKHMSVGQASVEAELLDSVSGERLMAGMDTRYGGKVISGKFDSWDDVKSAFSFWASRFNKRLYSLK